MQRLEVSGAVRLVYRSLGIKRLKKLSQHQVLFGDSYTVTKYESRPNVLEMVDFVLFHFNYSSFHLTTKETRKRTVDYSMMEIFPA